MFLVDAYFKFQDNHCVQIVQLVVLENWLNCIRFYQFYQQD